MPGPQEEISPPLLGSRHDREELALRTRLAILRGGPNARRTSGAGLQEENRAASRWGQGAQQAPPITIHTRIIRTIRIIRKILARIREENRGPEERRTGQTGLQEGLVPRLHKSQLGRRENRETREGRRQEQGNQQAPPTTQAPGNEIQRAEGQVVQTATSGPQEDKVPSVFGSWHTRLAALRREN